MQNDAEMKDENMSYDEVKAIIQKILYHDSFEQILMGMVEDVTKRKEISENDTVENFEIQVMIDAIKESETQDYQKPYLNLILGKLHTALES